jgi:hypothetical protein
MAEIATDGTRDHEWSVCGYHGVGRHDSPVREVETKKKKRRKKGDTTDVF